MAHQNAIKFSVFTKPWRELSIGELSKRVREFGFDGIEFPVREGYQVSPDTAERGLPGLVRILSEDGLRVYSVASAIEERVFAGCAEAGIPLIRIMVPIDADGYSASVERAQRQLEQVLPLCERYGIRIGIQQHYGEYIVDSTGLQRLVEPFSPNQVGVIWDAAHDALAGQEPEIGLEIVWSHLSMVNLKNAYYVRTNGPEAEMAEWRRHFTTGRHGLASWARVAGYLQRRGYHGVICLTGEYEAEHEVDRLIQEDIQYAKSLFARQVQDDHGTAS